MSPFPRPSPQGTPAALPYPLLRRLSSTSQRRAAPRSAGLRAARAGCRGALGGRKVPGVRGAAGGGGGSGGGRSREQCFKLPIRRERGVLGVGIQDFVDRWWSWAKNQKTAEQITGEGRGGAAMDRSAADKSEQLLVGTWHGQWASSAGGIFEDWYYFHADHTFKYHGSGANTVRSSSGTSSYSSSGRESGTYRVTNTGELVFQYRDGSEYKPSFEVARSEREIRIGAVWLSRQRSS